MPEGSTVADVTWGRGTFWSKVDTSKYTLLTNDRDPTRGDTHDDFRHLPYADSSLDALVFDPAYRRGGGNVKESLAACYNLDTTEHRSHESVMRLYAEGIIEAARVLKEGGVIIIKSQDETDGGKQCFAHFEIKQLLEILGFKVIDLLVLVQETTPIHRKKPQKSARKNHSYFLVARFRR